MVPNPPALMSGELLDEDDQTIIKGDIIETIAPDFGSNISTMTLTRWMCSLGSRVELDQPIYEASTDIVDSEVPRIRCETASGPCGRSEHK